MALCCMSSPLFLQLFFSSAVLLIHLSDTGPVPIQVEVQNPIDKIPPVTYSTHVVYRGILLGAMNRLMNSTSDFKFAYTEDPNYGPFLQSVNGVAGSTEKHTYWELLVQSPDGKITRPDVGIGCYIPKANEKIILRFGEW
uniref:Transcobalamin-like C-terminal domain-containing protein n=1 Tax=Seriola dumerili TaxID=41447 RepID=A0A3B4V7Q6_SERDU